MEISNLLKIIGLFINICGALMLFFATPKVNSETAIYSEKESPQMERKDLLKNRVKRSGALLLFLGFLCQLIALVID